MPKERRGQVICLLLGEREDRSAESLEKVPPPHATPPRVTRVGRGIRCLLAALKPLLHRNGAAKARSPSGLGCSLIPGLGSSSSSSILAGSSVLSAVGAH